MSSEPRTVWTALRDNPEWRAIFMARSASLLGTWLNTLAIVHLLGEGEYTAALPLALVFVLKQAPVTLLGPAAGVVADRFDRRRIMIACDALSAVVVLGFLFAEPGSGRVYIYGLTLVQVSITTFFDPAYRAVIPDLVRDDDLTAANAIGAATWSTMFAIGTALGGVVLFFFGWKVAIVLDALSYVVSGLLIASVRDARTGAGKAERPATRSLGAVTLASILGIDDVRSGVAYLRSQPRVAHVLLAKTTWGTMGALTLFLTLLGASPAFRLAGSGDLGISLLWFCRAVGTGIGPFLARAIGRDDPQRLRWTIVLGFVLALVGYAALSQVEIVWLAGALVVLAHIGGSMIWVMSTVLLQKMVPSGFRGRTFATELGLVMMTSSASYLVYASLIDHASWTVPNSILIATGVTALFAIAWCVRAVRSGPQRGA